MLGESLAMLTDDARESCAHEVGAVALRARLADELRETRRVIPLARAPEEAELALMQHVAAVAGYTLATDGEAWFLEPAWHEDVYRFLGRREAPDAFERRVA